MALGGELGGQLGGRAGSAPSSSARSASPARSGVVLAPISAIAACSPGATTTAAPAMAKSPCVSAYSTKAVRAPAGSGGTSISTSSSSGSSAVISGPTKSSSALSTRASPDERRWKRASSAVRATGSSAEGSANATEPPTVPRVRTWGWPT